MIALLEPMLSDFREGTVGWMIQKRIEESRQPGSRQLGLSHEYTFCALQKAPIAAKLHSALKPLDFIEHCKARRATGALPQTVLTDMVTLSGLLRYAAEVWEMPDTALAAYKKAKPQLVKQQLIGRSSSRDRRPTQDELDRLLAYYDEQAKNPRTKIPMRAIIEFSLLSARRISETCRIRWDDIDVEKRTCLVRDLKSPSGKGVNDSFPLLGRAWDIVQAQPRRSDRIFPYRWKSASISYTTAKIRLGIKGLHLHDNRRECISRMFEHGFNVPEVAKLSLHRNPTVLLKTYTALKPEDLHRGPASKRTQP